MTMIALTTYAATALTAQAENHRGVPPGTEISASSGPERHFADGSEGKVVWQLGSRNLADALLALAVDRPSPGSLCSALATPLAMVFGLAQRRPARLEALLHTTGYNVLVANAGISGDTTGGMLSRVDSAVPRGTTLVLFAITNYNDTRRGVDPSQHTANAASIVGHIRALGGNMVTLRFSRLHGRVRRH